MSKSPAQLQREIDEALALPAQPGAEIAEVLASEQVRPRVHWIVFDRPISRRPTARCAQVVATSCVGSTATRRRHG